MGGLDASAGGTAARFNAPFGLAVDSTNNVYVADTGNSLIRRVTPTGVVTTFAGSAGEAGNVDETGSAARFNRPSGIGGDSSNNFYVADRAAQTVRKLTTATVVTTLAGGNGSVGSTDATGTAARFANPSGAVVDSGSNIFIGDSGNGTLRKVTSTGVVSTFAGTAGAFCLSRPRILQSS